MDMATWSTVPVQLPSYNENMSMSVRQCVNLSVQVMPSKDFSPDDSVAAQLNALKDNCTPWCASPGTAHVESQSVIYGGCSDVV